MMDVDLKNDGPVGLNYRSYEEAVQFYPAMEALNGADPEYAYRSLSRLIRSNPGRKRNLKKGADPYAYRSLSRLIRSNPGRKRNLKKGIIRRPIAARLKRARRGMNSNCLLNCCNNKITA